MFLFFLFLLLAADVLDDHGAIVAGVLGQLAHRLWQRLAQDLDAGQDVAFQALLDCVQRLDGVQQRHAAAGHDAFLDGRAGRAQRILDAVLLFLQLGLGAGADADDRHAARQLGQALLQLFLVVVAGGVLDLDLDLLDAALDAGRHRPCRRRWWCCPCRR